MVDSRSRKPLLYTEYITLSKNNQNIDNQLIKYGIRQVNLIND